MPDLMAMVFDPELQPPPVQLLYVGDLHIVQHLLDGFVLETVTFSHKELFIQRFQQYFAILTQRQMTNLNHAKKSLWWR